MTDVRRGLCAHDTSSAHRAEPSRRLHLVRADDHRPRRREGLLRRGRRLGHRRERSGEYQGYRMINRPTAALPAACCRSTTRCSSMAPGRSGSAISTSTTSTQTVASIETAGGKTLMAPTDIPNVGRIAMVADPQGAPFYVMKPIPPAGRENEPSDVFSPTRPGPLRVERAVDERSGRRAPVLWRPVRLDERRLHGDGRTWANTASSTITA